MVPPQNKLKYGYVFGWTDRVRWRWGGEVRREEGGHLKIEGEKRSTKDTTKILAMLGQPLKSLESLDSSEYPTTRLGKELVLGVQFLENFWQSLYLYKFVSIRT